MVSRLSQAFIPRTRIPVTTSVHLVTSVIAFFSTFWTLPIFLAQISGQLWCPLHRLASETSKCVRRLNLVML